MSARSLWACVSLVLVAGTAALGARQAVRPAATAFIHAVIIDGTGRSPIENGVVVVRGPVIEAAGPADQVSMPANAKVVDVRGKVVMPGLADMHVHLNGGWDGETTDLLGYQRYLNALLYAGVTTVLDTGNVLPYIVQLRAEVAAGRLLGPTIYCAGPLVDGPDPLWPPISYSLASVEQVPGVVRQLKAQGVDIIKGYVGLSNAMVAALAAEGRKQGLQLLLDQSWRNGSAELAAVGAVAFAHTPDMLPADEMLSLMKQRGAKFISTLSVVESKAYRRFSELAFLDHPLIKDTVPADILADVRAHKPGPNWGDGPKQSNDRRFAQQEANLKRLRDAGFLIAAGTDAPYPGVFFGEGIHRELELLVEAGFAPVEAIAAATGNAARFVGAEKQWGTLEAGKAADLIVVAGRPDRLIGDTRGIEMVMRRGELLARDRLKFDPKTDPGYRAIGRVAK